MAPAGSPRTGRYLIVLALIVIASYAVVLVKGLTPKLGLDLQGGTSVILTPKVEGGGAPNSGQLAQAVDIIRQRVNGIGVAESEVVTDGNNIVISVPGKGRDTVKDLGTTAQLRFREVLRMAAGTPAPTGAPSPAASAAPTGAPSPAASGAPSAAPSAAATPVPSASVQPRAVTGALVTAPTPTPTAATTAPPSAAPTTPPSAGATPAPAPAGTPTPDAQPTTDSPAVEEAFQKLDCTKELNRQGGSTDRPDEQTVACDREGTTKYLLAAARVVGTDVSGASATLDNQLGTEWQVIVDFTRGGQGKFTQLTRDTTGKQVAIVLDGVVISAPTIQDTIAGNAQITGNFTERESKNLANVLKFGALPLTFVTSQAESVSATLGGDQLHAGFLAGGLGLLLVILYSLLYYRGLGFVTIASLALAGFVTYLSVTLLGAALGFTLTLAGIAGLIVSIGITADSFVVYYERIKDEVREGKSLRSAVDRAWVRARRTILSADSVSFLAAVILYFLSVGAVKGFAFTLGLVTLIDVGLVILFTHPVVTLLVRTRLFNRPGFTGLGALRPAPAAALAAPRVGRPRPSTKGL